jgi:hypothetical protein
MPSSAGKRERERQKLEKAQAKAERKAARQADIQPEYASSARSESELIEDLGGLHRAFEAGEITLEDFETRRDRLQAELGQFS